MKLKVKGLTQNYYTENVLDNALNATNQVLDFDKLKRLMDSTDEKIEIT